MRVFSALIASATLLGLCCRGQMQCTLEQYIARLSDIECTQAERELVFNVFKDCGRDDLAAEVVDLCRTHENLTCNEQLLLIIFHNPLEIRNCYNDDEFRERTLPCTAVCKQDLEMFLNDTLGCCSRTIFEDQLVQQYPSIVLINGLIDMCNISRSLLPDQCTTPSTLSYMPSGAAGPSCTQNELDRKLVTLPCNPEYLEPRLDIARDCMFPANEEPAIACEENNDGIICTEFAADSTALDQVALNCIEGAETCSDTCRTSVVSFRDVLGCCVNNLYNNSLLSLYASSYELWSMCEVETIEFCGSKSGQLLAAEVTKLLLAVTFLVIALVL